MCFYVIVFVLCVRMHMFFLSVLSFCAALWKPCVCLNLCAINKVDWIELLSSVLLSP